MKKAYKRYIIIMTIAVVILNIVAWVSKGFCDAYIKYIFPIWVNTYGRFTGLFPFSVGEIMLVLALIIIIAAIIIGITLIFLRKKKKYVIFAKHYYKSVLAIFVTVCMIMTLNCTMLYHCTRIDPNKSKSDRQYSIEELEILLDYLTEQCNYYGARVERDENEYVVYDKDVKEQAITEMKKMSESLSRLKGYYPRTKDMMFSDLMSQSYTMGYYFPFSMESNINDKMYLLNYPSALCHELSHIKGYIYEDEANYIAFLACINSDDDFFRYSGYNSVIGYVWDAYIEVLDTIPEDEADIRMESRLDKLYYDDWFLLPETWEEVEETAVFDTQTVDELSDDFTETSLQLNGVSEGMAAYDGVVELLLQHYDGILY